MINAKRFTPYDLEDVPLVCLLASDTKIMQLKMTNVNKETLRVIVTHAADHQLSLDAVCKCNIFAVT